MKLEKAVELLQGTTFDMEETFWSELGGDVEAMYTLEVIDPETLLEDVDIDLDRVTDEYDLLDRVENGLYDIMNIGSEGVQRV